MDNFFFYFMDKMPIFICVADKDTKIPVYYNKIAAECIENLSDDKKIVFVNDVISLDSLIKYCETTSDVEKGRWYSMENTICNWIDGKERLLIIGSDHSKSISTEELMTIANYTDGLTGIYNRKIGLEMLAKFTNELKIGAPAFTICFIDLNDLKYVNDKNGHNAGDQYILTVVNLIKQSVRQSDVFARMGGDEFLIIFPKCTSDVVTKILEDVSKLLDAVNNSNDPRTYYSISYGVLEVGPDIDKDMETLLSDAGSIMYRMKSDYKTNRILPE